MKFTKEEVDTLMEKSKDNYYQNLEVRNFLAKLKEDQNK